MRTYKEISVKDVKVGKYYYFNVGLSVDIFKRVKATSERFTKESERIVSFYCPMYKEKKYGKAISQSLFECNTVYIPC